MAKDVLPKESASETLSLADYLLDSSLISPTNSRQLYNVKLVNCGDYIQLYELDKPKIKPLDKSTNFDELSLHNFKTSETQHNITHEINKKNIIRSKLACQRLAKCNSKDWQTFITLTFAENIENISQANKFFSYFIDKIRKIYKDLKYICIPEFQKRGAVHYHLLTNIGIDNTNLIYTQEGNKKFLHIKYWKHGFTNVQIIKGDIKKIIGYISKYMTKDVDNRLFSKHKYLYSQNLNKPTISYLDLRNSKHINFLRKYISDKSLIYENNYINPYNEEKIVFKEFLTNI